jgi:acyl-CoA synthetase (NDP forming)
MTVRDWFGDIASIRERYPDKPLLSVVVGHPAYVDDITSLCGRSVSVFTSPEPAAQALATLWSYSKTREKSEDRGSDIS